MEIDFGESVAAVEDFDPIGELFQQLIRANGVAKLKAQIDRGFNINTTGPSGRTLLMHAVHFVGTHRKSKRRERMLDSIICLMQNGANLNITDDWGDTALTLALRFRQSDLAMLFFVHGDYPSRIH